MDKKRARLYCDLRKSLNAYEQAFGSKIKSLVFEHGKRGISEVNVYMADGGGAAKSAKAIREERFVRDVSRIEQIEKKEIGYIGEFVRQEDGTIDGCNFSVNPSDAQLAGTKRPVRKVSEAARLKAAALKKRKQSAIRAVKQALNAYQRAYRLGATFDRVTFRRTRQGAIRAVDGWTSDVNGRRHRAVGKGIWSDPERTLVHAVSLFEEAKDRRVAVLGDFGRMGRNRIWAFSFESTARGGRKH